MTAARGRRQCHTCNQRVAARAALRARNNLREHPPGSRLGLTGATQTCVESCHDALHGGFGHRLGTALPPLPSRAARCRSGGATRGRLRPSSRFDLADLVPDGARRSSKPSRSETATLRSTWGHRSRAAAAMSSRRAPLPRDQVGEEQARQDAVAGRGQRAEHDVPRLLAAQCPAVRIERLQDVAVADADGLHLDPRRLHRLMEPEVRHHRDHNGPARKAGPGPPGRWRRGRADGRRRRRCRRHRPRSPGRRRRRRPGPGQRPLPQRLWPGWRGRWSHSSR